MNRSYFVPLFEYEHLPAKLQERSKPFCELARKIMETWPDNEESIVALRKLLESKDAGVRAFVVESVSRRTA